jgi:hypothetical protein
MNNRSVKIAFADDGQSMDSGAISSQVSSKSKKEADEVVEQEGGEESASGKGKKSSKGGNQIMFPEDSEFFKKWAAPVIIGPFLPCVMAVLIIVSGQIVLNTWKGTCGYALDSKCSIWDVLRVCFTLTSSFYCSIYLSGGSGLLSLSYVVRVGIYWRYVSSENFRFRYQHQDSATIHVATVANVVLRDIIHSRLHCLDCGHLVVIECILMRVHGANPVFVYYLFGRNLLARICYRGIIHDQIVLWRLSLEDHQGECSCTDSDGA